VTPFEMVLIKMVAYNLEFPLRKITWILKYYKCIFWILKKGREGEVKKKNNGAANTVGGVCANCFSKSPSDSRQGTCHPLQLKPWAVTWHPLKSWYIFNFCKKTRIFLKFILLPLLVYAQGNADDNLRCLLPDIHMLGQLMGAPAAGHHRAESQHSSMWISSSAYVLQNIACLAKIYPWWYDAI
jgi:hypothetical protein